MLTRGAKFECFIIDRPKNRSNFINIFMVLVWADECHESLPFLVPGEIIFDRILDESELCLTNSKNCVRVTRFGFSIRFLSLLTN